MPEVPQKPPCLFADLAKIKDPIARARTAAEFAAYAENLARLARGIRDEAIRSASTELRKSKAQIATETEINVHTIKAVLR